MYCYILDSVLSKTKYLISYLLLLLSIVLAIHSTDQQKHLVWSSFSFALYGRLTPSHTTKPYCFFLYQAVNVWLVSRALVFFPDLDLNSLLFTALSAFHCHKAVLSALYNSVTSSFKFFKPCHTAL